jgi:hypothetical protein
MRSGSPNPQLRAISCTEAPPLSICARGFGAQAHHGLGRAGFRLGFAFERDAAIGRAAAALNAA